MAQLWVPAFPDKWYPLSQAWHSFASCVAQLAPSLSGAPLTHLHLWMSHLLPLARYPSLQPEQILAPWCVHAAPVAAVPPEQPHTLAAQALSSWR